MTYEVAVENGQDGYVATVLGWPACVAKARTREKALALLRQNLNQRLAEVEIISLEVSAQEREHPMLKFAGVFKDDPLFDEVTEEIEAYRRELDADEGAA